MAFRENGEGIRINTEGGTRENSRHEMGGVIIRMLQGIR